ncbi:hypothetical protein AAG570_012287 [Ranatra chinensis]|uniref:Integrase catalytic domain-containing protein n=1 Tax=Ranatra chinensis TaxID=642074 RepID=A0ABD0YIK4_9HEMI
MVNAIDSPSPTFDAHGEVEWDPENFDLSLLRTPEGESSEPPGLSRLRRRAEEGPDLPAVPEAAARVTPVSRPESERGSAGQRRLLWEVGPLNDKAVGTPRTLVLDQGRVFRNFVVRGFLEEFHIRVHWTTPGHPRSHGMIERLHGTLQEHLHILRIGRGMTGEEAWARALLAYNSSLHSATGYTPLELMRAWQREDSPVSIEYVCGELVDQDDRKKRVRVDRLNNKATDRWDRVQAGDYVFIKNWYRRRKTDPRFVGPYIVETKLSRFRLKVKCAETGRVLVIHVNESRPPRARQP